MSLGDFVGIMGAIIGTPTNDIESTILYFISALLGASIIYLVLFLFGIAGQLLVPRYR